MLTPPLEQLLPHAGRMRLIDRIVIYDEHHIVCESDSHRVAEHPLAQDGALSILCGLEYGAQAMAIHGALLAAGERTASHSPRHGLLVAASDLRWSVDRLDQCSAPVTIEAISEFRSGNQVAYTFELRTGGQSILSGRASVVLSSP